MSRVSVARLVTHASLEALSTSTYSVRLLLVARLDDGREVALLDDRGFSARSNEPRITLRRADIEKDARICVGPDEPFGDETREFVERAHWDALAQRLRGVGVAVCGEDLRELEHEVVFDERLEAAVV